MQFNSLIVAVAGLVASAQATIPAVDFVNNLNSLTTSSNGSQTIALTVNYQNYFSTGPQFINSVRAIVQEIASEITSYQAGPSIQYAVNEQEQVLDAYRAFVAAQTALLQTTISKESIFAQSVFAAPIAAVLRSLEGGSDTLAYAVIDSVPSYAQQATASKVSLDGTLTQSLQSYTS